MIRTVWRALLISVSFLASASAGAEESLQVVSAARESFSGHFSTGNTQIQFETGLPMDDLVIVTVSINDKTLSVHFPVQTASLSMDGHGSILNAEEKIVLAEMSQQLSDYMEERPNQHALHTYILVRLLQYWADTPDNHVLERSEVLAVL